MGLFKKDPWKNTADGKYRDGVHFTLPCTPSDSIEILTNYAPRDVDSIGQLGHLLRGYLQDYGNEFGIDATVPATAELYVAKATPTSVTVRAGSRSVEFWRIEVQLVATSYGTAGVAKWIPTSSPNDPLMIRWKGNVINIFSNIEAAVTDNGGSCDAIPLL